MKMTVFLLGLFLSLSSFAGKIEVDITGMTCGMCVESITKELKATNKTENIAVSLEQKKATFFELKDKMITDAEIKNAVKKAGYDAVKIRRY